MSIFVQGFTGFCIVFIFQFQESSVVFNFVLYNFQLQFSMNGYQNQASKANKKVHSFGFTKHFSKDFMHPYGETDRPHMGTAANFNRKLTCEWLARPSGAASELADVNN